MNVKAQVSKTPIVHLAAVATCLYPEIMKAVNLDSLQDSFYPVRIVNGKTGRIVRCEPLMSPHHLKMRYKNLESNELMMVLKNGIWTPSYNNPNPFYSNANIINVGGTIYRKIGERTWEPVRDPTTIENIKMNCLDCTTCYGYGMWPDEADFSGGGIPMTRDEAEDGEYSDPCPYCKSENWFYWKKEDRTNVISLPLVKSSKKDFSSLMSDFVKIAQNIKNEENNVGANSS